VADGRLHRVAPAQVLPDGLRLGGRLDDDERALPVRGRDGLLGLGFLSFGRIRNYFDDGRSPLLPAAAFFFTGFFLAATDQPFIINGPGDGRGGIFTSLHRSAQGRPGPAPLAPPPSCPSQPSRPLGDTRPRDPSRAPSSAPPGPPPLTTGGFPRGPRGRRPSAGSSSDTPQTPEASPRQWRPVVPPSRPPGR